MFIGTNLDNFIGLFSMVYALAKCDRQGKVGHMCARSSVGTSHVPIDMAESGTEYSQKIAWETPIGETSPSPQ